jgi:hypothetical protein
MKKAKRQPTKAIGPCRGVVDVFKHDPVGRHCNELFNQCNVGTTKTGSDKLSTLSFLQLEKLNETYDTSAIFYDGVHP